VNRPAPKDFNFVANVMEEWARRDPDALALWWVDENERHQRKITVADIVADAHRAANFFRDCDITPGDPVLVMLPRIPEWWITMLGLIRLGAVPVPSATMLTTRDVRYRIEAAGVRAVITDADGISKLDWFSSKRILVGSRRPGWTSFQAGLRDASPKFTGEPTRADDPGIVYFTSATAGEPKMVLHTQASYGLAHRVTGKLWLDLKPGDLHWCITDTGWGKAAWSCFFGPWLSGATVFAMDARRKFSASCALRTLSSYPITTWCAPPTALRLIVREDLTRFRFPHLRHCASAGEPLNPEVITAWREATGTTIYEGYGQTETVVLIANIRSRRRKVRPGSMRCQGDAPDGCGKGITSTACPRYDTAKLFPMSSVKGAIGRNCEIASLPTGSTSCGRKSANSRSSQPEQFAISSGAGTRSPPSDRLPGKHRQTAAK